MKTVRSYVGGGWLDGSGTKTPLHNPATGDPIGEVAAGAIEWGPVLERIRGGAGEALRDRSFAQRGEILRAMSKLVHDHRDELITLAIANGGNTRSDAKFDIDGASGTLMAYAELGQKLGASKFLIDGESIQLTRSVRFFGQHIAVPRRGVAVHINAFNFPAWNMTEKAACALLAGVPVVAKPATATALVAHRITELFVENQGVPEGVWSFVAGGVGDLLSHLSGQDMLAFTGSSATAATLRSHSNLIGSSVRINVEADSLNAAVLGPDLTRDSEGYSLFIADVVRDMTQKAGQKCTAIRRVLVPEAQLSSVREDLCDRLSAVKVGDPALQEVTMGPLATAAQLKDVREGISRLQKESENLFGGNGAITPIGVAGNQGYFVSPVLFQAAPGAQAVHQHEVFGPVATILPYDGVAQTAVDLVVRGAGGLVSSIYSDDRSFLGEMTFGLAPFHGRLFLGSSKLGGHAVGPGTVLPQMVHGGPGRAGGGEELGGARGLAFYLQRTAIAGDKPILEALFSKG